MYDFIIENNYIDGVSGSAPGINVSTGAIPVKNGKLSKNTVKNTGTNFAIKAIGADITTSDNTVDSFQSGILIDGGIGYGNIIKDVASQYTSGIALQTGNNSNVYGNKFSGKGQAVINGTNGIFKDNIFEYTGTDVPIRLYSVATGNIIKDNIFPTNTGTAKILGNSATWYTDNDVYIDKVTNGTVYYIAPDVDGGGGAVTYTPDLKNGRFQLFKFNGTTAMTVNNPTNGMIGQELVLRLTNGNGSTAITPTFGVNFSMGTPVAISAGKRSVYRFLLADKWYLISATENF
jgi:hypothetical protein